MENHEPFLREAIALSKSAMENGDEPFGSVLVKGGEVILRAENSVFTGHDMTNHAEMNLVKLAAKQYDTAFLAGCTLYTSTEPCAMCSGAIYWSGIGRMVFACSETRLGEIAGIGLNVPSRAVLQTGAHRHHGWPKSRARRRSRRSPSEVLAQAPGQDLGSTRSLVRLPSIRHVQLALA
jgi:tRNA(Arg) A34 adenosine deaminase TadA